MQATFNEATREFAITGTLPPDSQMPLSSTGKSKIAATSGGFTLAVGPYRCNVTIIGK
jgi:hypothetical protein